MKRDNQQRPTPADWNIEAASESVHWDDTGKVTLYQWSDKWALAWETEETNDETRWFAWGRFVLPIELQSAKRLHEWFVRTLRETMDAFEKGKRK